MAKKNIFITGVSRGIGEAVSLKIAQTGDNRLFLLSRNKKRMEQLREKLLADNPANEVFILAFDLNNTGLLSELKAEVLKNTDTLDILINNAGTIVVKQFSESTESDIDRQFDVNYKAPALLIKEFLPLLKKSKKAHVVNISSMAGFQGSQKFPGLSHYSSSKAAISALTECLAAEIKGNIAFNALCIGSVQTEMLAEAFPGFKAPLQPEEMGEFIANFALTGHKFINGKVLPVSFSNPS